jgi:hypothetical protein
MIWIFCRFVVCRKDYDVSIFRGGREKKLFRCCNSLTSTRRNKKEKMVSNNKMEGLQRKGKMSKNFERHHI